ncbi:MAG: hypothetical protein N3J91_15825 [Verrucomicrobiae bacterium]|nr:hypothetical protein [Verrucomicrobiae bacterium]
MNRPMAKASPRQEDRLVPEAGEQIVRQPFSARQLARLPRQATAVSLLGVDYTHLKTSDGGELYLTRYGLPYWEHLLPENWFGKEWFEAKRERLIGTSTVYRVPTKPVEGVSLHLVVKWSRVGEVVPLDTLTVNKFINAEFNSPFEEFALVMEMRRGEYGPPRIRIRTQKPLAIYVPSERLQLWQTGRSQDRIAAKIAQSPGVEIDILRQYVLLYGWIKGLDLVETATLFQLTGEAREEFLASVTSLVNHELEHKGYRMVDMKPQHIIVRPQPDFTLLRDRNRQVVYAVVDYELLERTPEHEQAVASFNRQYYLEHMARRFEVNTSKPLPAHLKTVNILGVDYIYGQAESTGGRLWVVGKDPDLFNYFLPERWRRTPKKRLSERTETYLTRTKDNINLVWKVSRMGSTPHVPDDSLRSRRILEYGFNSPFEEFACALGMSGAGARTVYPRAIYMTGSRNDHLRKITDASRYQRFAEVLMPDGEPLLQPGHDYISIWGFWNGPDVLLAISDGSYFRGVNVREAHRQGLITDEELEEFMERARRRFERCGYEDLNLEPEHLLISFDPENRLVRDTLGKPELRLCNFELVRPVHGFFETASVSPAATPA